MAGKIGDMEPIKFESRIGKVEASAETVFNFLCDMRNFSRFIPEGTVSNWEATTESCTFDLSPAGAASLSIVDRKPFSMVKYGGEALNNSESFLWVQLKEVNPGDTRVKITLKAAVNPALKMLISKPVKDLLERLLTGLEDFSDWNGEG